jgi:hypothetical protein
MVFPVIVEDGDGEGTNERVRCWRQERGGLKRVVRGTEGLEVEGPEVRSDVLSMAVLVEERNL